MAQSSIPSASELLRAKILIAKSVEAKKKTEKKVSRKTVMNENEDPASAQPERKRRKAVTVACVC